MDTDLGRGPPGSHVDRWAGEQHGGPGFDLLSGGRSSASHTKWELLTPGRWKVREEACEARPGAATKAGHTPHHLLTNEPGRSLPLQLSSRSSRGHPAARLPCPAWYLKATRSSSFPTHQPVYRGITQIQMLLEQEGQRAWCRQDLGSARGQPTPVLTSW